MSIEKSDLTRADLFNMRSNGMETSDFDEFVGNVYDDIHHDEIRKSEFYREQQDFGLVSFFLFDDEEEDLKRVTAIVGEVDESGVGIFRYEDQEKAHQMYDSFWKSFSKTREITESSYSNFLTDLRDECGINTSRRVSFFRFAEIINPAFGFRKLSDEQSAEIECVGG